MKSFLLSVAMIFLVSLQAAHAQSNPTQIVRSGDIVVIPNTCLVLDLAILDKIILQGKSTVQSILIRALSEYRELSPEELALCGGGEVVDTVDVWVVAQNGSSADRSAKRLVLNATGDLVRVNSPIRLPVGDACMNDGNGYEADARGNNKMWRNPLDMDEYAVVCEKTKVEVPKVSSARGFNFRSTADHVEDLGNDRYAGSGVIYPTESGGGSYGWESGDPCFRDRSLNGPVKLSGIACVKNDGNQATFRIDLAGPGVHTIRVAIGDIGENKDNVYVQILDGTNVIIQSSNSAGVDLDAGEFIDASGMKFYTAESWVDGNTPFIYDFKTSILRIVIGHPLDVGSWSTVSHVSVSAVVN